MLYRDNPHDLFAFTFPKVCSVLCRQRTGEMSGVENPLLKKDPSFERSPITLTFRVFYTFFVIYTDM